MKLSRITSRMLPDHECSPAPLRRKRTARRRCKTLLSALALVFGASMTGQGAAEQELEMDGMAVIGNRELPKALFIVPWQDPEMAMAPDRPLNTLIDEALQPVDPEVFRRKLQYFEAIHRKD